MLLVFAQPLLADLTELFIGLAVLLIAVVKQLIEANKQAGPKRVAPPAAPQQQPQAMAKKAAAGGQQADPLRNQVEEFLRRAGRPSQGDQTRPPQQRPASEIELLVNDTSRSPERRSLTSGAPAPRPQPPVNPDKRPACRSVIPKRRVTLAERAITREEIRVGNLPDQPPQLGKRIIEEDKQFDQQVKAKFDHTVGTLGGDGTLTESQKAALQSQSPAAQIAAMLSNPGGVRQAVIVNEILRRPSDRW